MDYGRHAATNSTALAAGWVMGINMVGGWHRLVT